MGYKISIVFDLKVNNEPAKEQLKKLVKDNFERFTSNIRKTGQLEIRLEEKDY